MNTNLIIRARTAIETLAERDSVRVEEVRAAIQDCILAAQKSATPQSELLWNSMTADGSLPSPEELIAWVARMILRDE